MKRGLATLAVLLAVLAEVAGAATTRFDEHGTVLVDGRKVFPIVLAKGPEGSTLDRVVAAGVNFLKTGPASRPWWPEDIADAVERNREAADRGVYTWVNLATLSDADPGSLKETRLREVVTALESDSSASALAMWKGADEPWWARFPPAELQFAYCIATSRGDPSWCGDRPVADDGHLWVTIQAPRGTPVDLAPYSAVTDVHGVDHYPVTFSNPDPNLHEVGIWTDTIRSVTPSRSVWTTLQVCASGSSGPDGSFVLPQQERYMIYDAIINGARSLAFYGGNLDRCWSETDRANGWNWTFWDSVLEDLVREINAESPIAPVLVNPGSTKKLESSDATTQVISRSGVSESELWVIAARHGPGTEAVAVHGLPATVREGTAYTEGRSISVTNGSFTDSFSRWDVHVYRFTVPSPPATPPPPPPPPPPAPPEPPAPAPPPPAPPPPPPAPEAVRAPTRPAALSIRRAATTRSGRILTRRLWIATEIGSAVTTGAVNCGARLRRTPLRVVRKGWRNGSAFCSWRLPRGARGKTLRGVVRIDTEHLSLTHRFAARPR